MADRTYNKEDIDKYLKAEKDYLNGNDTSGAFENIHELAIEDLKGFIDGNISVTPDAFESMSNFINTFAGGYKDEQMKKLYNSALEKLNKMQEEHKKQVLAQELEALLKNSKEKEQANKKADEQPAKEKTEQEKIKETANRVIALFKDVNNNKSGRLDSIQKELSALSGAQIGALYTEINGREEVSNTIKRKFKQQLTYNLEGKYLVQEGKDFVVNQEAVSKVSDEDAKGYVTALEGVKESSYNVIRVDALYAAFLRQNGEEEKAKELQSEEKELQPKEEKATGLQAKEEKGLDSNGGNGGNNKNLTNQTQNNEFRLRSDMSDNNEVLMYRIRIEALADMGIVTAKNEAFASDNPEALIDLLQDKASSLSDEQIKEMESRMADIMLEEPKVFEAIPPKVLAQKYNELKEELNTPNTPEHHQSVQAKLDKFTQRIDTLIDMMAKDEHENKDLFFADITNIADAHEGYMEMFKARKPDLEEMAKNEDTKAVAEAKLAQIDKGTQILDDHLADYKRDWNLAEIQENDADKLDARFEDIQAKMKDVELAPETLKLVSNFKFMDAEGNVEPQFIDKDGNKTDVYTDGAKVIEGSKLDELILLTKQNVMLENLGSNEEITPEFLTKEVSEQLPSTLYLVHINDMVYKGGKENPNQFTDETYLNNFIRDLNNPEVKMQISNEAYNVSKDVLVNKTGAYASCLGQIVGKDKPVVTKLFNPIAKIDSLAKDRVENSKMNSWEARKILAARLGKSGLATFGVSTGLTLLSGATNKGVGLAVGLGIGIAAGYNSYRKWKKSRKQEGKKAGFKELLQEPKLLASFATTGFSAAAAVSIATGHPDLAVAFGVGALVVGTGNAAISTIQDAKKMGLSKLESYVWGGLQVAVNAGAAYGGRALGEHVIENSDSKIFNHEEQKPDGR